MYGLRALRSGTAGGDGRSWELLRHAKLPIGHPGFFGCEADRSKPMAFTLQTLNAFEMTHRSAACEIKPTRSGCRAFAAVYPPLPEKHIQQWRLKRLEIPEGLVSQNPYDGDLVDLQFIRVDTLEEVEKTLPAWGIDSSLFDAPWKSDYPV